TDLLRCSCSGLPDLCLTYPVNSVDLLLANYPPDAWGFTKKPKQSERGRHRLLTEQLADTRAGGVRRSKQTKSNKRELTGSAHGE
ncbi:hypothetical protein AMECASPLE_015754, partial [Ameca splendens]